MKEFKRILVTGADGFIGTELVTQLKGIYPNSMIVGISRKRGRVVSYENLDEHYQEVRCDITKAINVCELLTYFNPDVIFHLAGNPIVKLDEENPTAATITNIVGTQNLLHYSPRGSTFVLASSATVYGDNVDWSHEASPLHPSSAYGATKVGAEAMVMAYTNMGRVNGIILRYVANVGRGATHGVLIDFIKKLRSDSMCLEILGEYPGSFKPYMHVSDTASATIFAAQNLSGEFNVSVPTLLSSWDIAEITMEVMGIRKPLQWLPNANWVGDNKVVKLFHGKLYGFGWKPQYKNSAMAVKAAVKELMI